MASLCEVNNSGFGSSGFLYESVKDRLRWEKIRAKFYIKLIMDIGKLVVLKDDEFNKEITKHTKQDKKDMAAMLKAAFGVKNGSDT